MLVWLDGRMNTRQRPQENFGREIMELFTFGIGNYTEQDVYAAARVFTGWNLRLRRRPATTRTAYYEFVYNAEPARPDGEDVHVPDLSERQHARSRRVRRATACRTASTSSRRWRVIRETARRLARKMWNFFVSEVVPPDDATFVNAAAQRLPAERHRASSRWCTTCCARVSSRIRATGTRATRGRSSSSCARSRRSAGRASRSTRRATPLIDMGQTLFEPPDVNGWELGQGWFSTGAMLARMNFAAHARVQPAIQPGARRAPAHGRRRKRCSTSSSIGCRRRPYEAGADATNLTAVTCRRGGTWTGSDAQLAVEGAGLTRLIVGSSEYQFVLDGEIQHHGMSLVESSFAAASRRSPSASPRRRFSSDIAAPRARARATWSCVYLSGGNDALSTVVPYRIRSITAGGRRSPIPAGQVLQIGSDSSGKALGLHPRLTGLRDIFNEGRLGDRPAHRLSELEPVAFPGHRHLGHRRSRRSPTSMGWLGPLSRDGSRSIRWPAGARRASCRAR